MTSSRHSGHWAQDVPFSNSDIRVDELSAASANIAVIRGPEFARRNRLFVQTGATAEFGRCKTLSLIRMLRYFFAKIDIGRTS